MWFQGPAMNIWWEHKSNYVDWVVNIFLKVRLTHRSYNVFSWIVGKWDDCKYCLEFPYDMSFGFSLFCICWLIACLPLWGWVTNFYFIIEYSEHKFSFLRNNGEKGCWSVSFYCFNKILWKMYQGGLRKFLWNNRL